MKNLEQLDSDSLFDLVVTGKADLSQYYELKDRVDNDPLMAWFYKDSLFERNFAEQFRDTAQVKVDQLQSEALNQPKNPSLEEIHEQLERAKDLDLGL